MTERKTVRVDHHDFECQDPHCDAHRGMRQLMVDIAERIQRKEWTVMSSAIDHPRIRNHQVPISYTIGLMAQGQPEILVYGLEANTAGHMLNQAAEMRLRDELVLDVPTLGFIVGQPVIFKQVDQDMIAGIFGWIRKFSPDGQSAQIWQMVWPDRQNAFPWEPQFDQSLHRFFWPHFKNPALPS